MIRTIVCLICFSSLSTLSIAQSWQPVTSPPDFRTDHSYGFSLNGLGYLVAGLEEFDGPSSTFLQYDPATDEWTPLDDFPGAGRGYGIGDVYDGKAYFGFGNSVDSILADLWVFDPDSMKWSQLAYCPCDGRLHPTFVASNGKIFVGQGNNSNGNLTDWWEYDIATDTWSQKTEFPGLRRHHPYMFASGDYVYTGLGHGNGAIYRDWYRYDPATETWDQMADIPGEGRVAGTQFSYNNTGFVLSGDGDDHFSMETGEFWSYNPEADSWLELPPHPGKSRWAPSSFIIDGEVYLFNGTSYFDGVGSVYQTDSYKFSLDSLFTSNFEIGDPDKLIVYPNPFTSSIVVQLPDYADAAMRIYSMDNKLVASHLLNQQAIDLSHLKSGAYRIEVIAGNTRFSKIVIRQ
jgi:N-acetylneuraminic acid mutarotase